MNSINILKKKLKNNITLVKNFSYLTILRVFTILLPIVTVPYLIKILGSEFYGMIAYAQAITSYLSIIIAFGFNLTATKSVSIFRNNKEKISEIVSSVFIIKFFLTIIAFLILYCMIELSPKLHSYKILYYLSFGYCLRELLFPIWYFQGIEKMKYIVLIDVISRLLFTILIFVFIKRVEQYYQVPLLMGIGNIVAGIISLVIIFHIHHVNFHIPSFSLLINCVKESSPLFAASLSSQLYLYANKIVLGTFNNMNDVAIYDVAEKVVRVLKIPLSIISRTVYPKISRDKNIFFIKRASSLTFFIMLFVVTLIFLTGNKIILYFAGSDFVGSSAVLKILALSVLPISLSEFYGVILLNSFGYQKQFSIIVITMSVLYIGLIYIFYIFNVLTINQVVIVSVIIEVYGFLCFYGYSKTKKLI